MKLDYDLIRELLIITEEYADGRFRMFHDFYEARISHPEQGKLVEYHLQYLSDVHYIKRTRGKVYGRYYVTDITPAGREYLNSVRSSKVWNAVKPILKATGEVTLEIVKTIASQKASQFFGG